MTQSAFKEATKRIKKQSKRFYEKTVYIVLSPYRLFKFICFSLGLVTMLLGLSLSIYTYSFFNSLPNIEKMSFSRLKRTAVRVTNRKFENKKRKIRWVPLAKVNRDLLYAIVMSEDGHFFEHGGVNYDAILDSLARNIKKRKYVAGGSTISQQVAKNLFFKNTKSLSRKVKEVLVTKELEKKYSKNQILEVYLNMAEFGPDIFGVHQASWHFFRKSPRRINAAEGAFLALMLPSPRRNYYSIFQNQNLTRKKRRKIRRVLRDMLYQEYISPKQYRRYTRYNYFRRVRRPAGR